MVSENQKIVLDHFGLSESDLPELERSVDIEALAEHIRKPTRTAVCNILDDKGKVVVNKKGLACPPRRVKVYVEVPVENALKILAKKSLRFLKWF